VKALTQDQVIHLVEAADKTREPRRNRALVLFLLETGARDNHPLNLV